MSGVPALAGVLTVICPTEILRLIESARFKHASQSSLLIELNLKLHMHSGKMDLEFR